jgi:hypothetical protein
LVGKNFSVARSYEAHHFQKIAQLTEPMERIGDKKTGLRHPAGPWVFRPPPFFNLSYLTSILNRKYF